MGTLPRFRPNLTWPPVSVYTRMYTKPRPILVSRK
jgi:hypothetical protein